ncbi:class I SAM-dependent methyltransferase [Gilvimarinus polysaccharolyticus]|uniref:class I SAM-dependent methyltransferase n=1 Tax=Gilvimarinus polysaccharolyticus TaxID=863921 RepID=UPI0006737352|nr:class I SAM-dependent methyltransferase [Gilvimarinus polysaccharolyticus]
MLIPTSVRCLSASVLLALSVVAVAHDTDNEKLNLALHTDYRSDAAVRDEHRHPAETLTFFGVEPDMTVVEIWPGGGWYTDILAAYLRDSGTYYAAHFDPNSEVGYFKRSREAFGKKMAEHPERYDQVKLSVFNPPAQYDIAPEGSADVVLTFRNAHNWYMNGGGEKRVLAAFSAFYRSLKPGGVLGVVDHRLPEDRDIKEQDASGYMKQSVIENIAKQAGFELVASSDINANPKDTANHEKGVWTLPPSYRLGDIDRAKYQKIGESDRMTLKFVKPKK